MTLFQAAAALSSPWPLCCRVKPCDSTNGERVLSGTSAGRGWPHLTGHTQLLGHPGEQHGGAMLQCPLTQHRPARAAIWWCAHCARHQLHPLAGEQTRRVPCPRSCWENVGVRTGSSVCCVPAPRRIHPWETRNSRVLKETLLPHLMHAGDSLQPEDVWVHVMPCYYDLCGPSSCEVLPALSSDSVGQSLLCWYLGSQRYIW